MNRLRNLNSLLVEIMIAVLFFALCATVILEMFVMARDYSHIAGVDTEAMVKMQSLAERMYAQSDAEALLQEVGFELQGDIWVESKLCTQQNHDFRLEVELTEEQTAVGLLKRSVIRAVRGGEIVAEIPGVRYESHEVSE